MKKIAYFSGQLFGEYIIEVTRALIHRAEELGYQVDVFTNFGVYGNNFMYAEGEKSIIQLPNLSEYAGVIAASDNFEISGFEEVLFERLEKEFSGPIVSLRQKEDKFYSITIDDYHSMKALMEHFIVTHGYRRICFMTGRMELEDAQQRLRAYQDAMEEHGIPVTEHMIFEGDYWRFKGGKAVSWFFDQEKLPEAIVCSNDYMALSVFEELIARGIRVPEDIALSGFDDLEETKFSVPPITTLHMPKGCGDSRCPASGRRAEKDTGDPGETVCQRILRLRVPAGYPICAGAFVSKGCNRDHDVGDGLHECLLRQCTGRGFPAADGQLLRQKSPL